MKYKALILVAFLAVSNFSVAKKSFLIPKDNFKKRLSKNDLKYDLGGELKQALYDCNDISRELGILQTKLAGMRETLLTRVGELIADKRRFKKAKRGELSKSIKILSEARSVLRDQKINIKKIAMKMETSKCLSSKKNEKGRV